jgi:uncharacterized surface protein with fasciclin (FAS1) repeats
MNSSSNVKNQRVSQNNLIQAAAAQGNFKTFGKAVESAGLTKLLSGTDSYTIFAPTDAAFQLLPPGKLDTLLQPENKGELVSLLNAHIVSGRKNATDVGKMGEAKTVNGTAAPVNLDGKQLSFGGANVSAMNIESSNGFIHGIDKVVLPATITKQ